MTPAAAEAAAVAVCRRVLESPEFAAARHIVAYVAGDHEIDPGALCAAALAAGKRVYYPRVAGAGLEFLAGDPATFARGFGGTREPVGGEPLPGDAQALFLVPGVAFDLRGARLGRGGGHYDRALSARPGTARIGLAFEFQILPRLPEERWDVRMRAVATDVRLVPGRAS